MRRLSVFGGGTTSGYTIIEVIIFLAVSGALFVSASLLISGRQEKTMFQQSVNTMSQEIEDVLNDVSTGYYASSGSIKCSKGVSGKIDLSGTSGDDYALGTNDQCVFSGKLINFNVGSTQYNIYSLASIRPADSVIDPSIQNVHSGLLGRGTNQGIMDSRSNGVDLQVTKIVDKDGASISQNLVVASDFGSVGSDGRVSGNASKASLYSYGDSLDNFDGSKLVLLSSSVIICLQQSGGGDSRSAYITITPQLTVDRIIGSKGPGC